MLAKTLPECEVCGAEERFFFTTSALICSLQKLRTIFRKSLGDALNRIAIKENIFFLIIVLR